MMRKRSPRTGFYRNVMTCLVVFSLASLHISCDLSNDDPELGTCRLYNNWNQETYEIRNNITLEACRKAAENLPSNTTYWSAFDWTEN